MSDKCETMRIVSENPKSQGPFILINKEDFDPKTHKEFKGKGKAKEAKSEDKTFDEEVFSSKAAAAAAEKAGLTPDQITPTGTGDKITAADVKVAAKAAEEADMDDEDENEDDEDDEDEDDFED